MRLLKSCLNLTCHRFKTRFTTALHCGYCGTRLQELTRCCDEAGECRGSFCEQCGEHKYSTLCQLVVT